MFNGIFRVTEAISAKHEVDFALATEALNCEHDAERQCQQCYFEALADRW